MQKAKGVRNLSELTELEKDNIIAKFYQKDMTAIEITKFFKLTKRALGELFKERNINARKLNRYSLNENYFSNISTERQAYWLGYLYADGFVGNEHYNNIVFSQKLSDGYAVQQFASDIKYTGDLRISQSTGGFKGQKQLVLNFSSKTMADDLKRLKMETKKSLTMKELPPIEQKLMRHFIRGYFDGDGSISRNLKHQCKNGNIHYSYRCSIIGTTAF